MAEVLVGAGGCLAGAISWQLLTTVLQKKRRGGKAGAEAAVPPNTAAKAMAALQSPGLRFSSPTKARSNYSGKLRGVSGDVSLTSKMADLSKVPGLSKEMDGQAFIELLRKLIGEAKHLQNNPRLGITPQESKAAKIVMHELEPYSTKNGGPLIIEEMEFKSGRSNVKITYPGTTQKTIAFVGSHLDVVPADPETWDKDPFQLTVEGDNLYGRGTTDCLGHVALLTRFLAELGSSKPKLKRTIVVLFIAGEEGGEVGVGVDMVLNAKRLDEAKRGPVYWVDSADSQPCCGCSGTMSWSLKATGRIFHSGFPHKGINSIELAAEAVSMVQQRFYDDFPPTPAEEAYQFSAGSNMKPTQIECAKGGLNQICPTTTVSGDIRLSPFYEVEDVIEAVERYVKDINDYIDELPTKGTWSKFVLDDSVMIQEGELRRAKVELKWLGDMHTFKTYAGVAVNLESEGHKAIVQACRETNASCKPFSVNGSLPLVKIMQQAGFDIQLCGFGLMSVYHGVNEYCTLSGMQKAHEVLVRIVSLLEDN